MCCFQGIVSASLNNQLAVNSNYSAEINGKVCVVTTWLCPFPYIRLCMTFFGKPHSCVCF